MSEEIGNVIAARPLDHWRRVFHGSACCVSPVNTLKEALQFTPPAERGMLSGLIHPTLGMIPQMIFPVDRSLRSHERRGADDGARGVQARQLDDRGALQELLAEAGVKPEELEELKSAEIISLADAEKIDRL